MSEKIVIKATIKNSIGKHGMIQAPELKALAGKKATVTIDVDEGTEITTPPKTEVK